MKLIVFLSLIALNLANSKAELKPLLTAVQNKDISRVQSLLSDKGIFAQTTVEGLDALMLAAKIQNADLVEVLIQGGFSPKKTSKNGNSALHWCLWQPNFSPIDDQEAREEVADIVEMLVWAGADSNLSNEMKMTPLMLAVSSNQILAMEILLKSGAMTSKQDKEGNTALHGAVLQENLEALSLLLKAGANPNLSEENKLCALDLSENPEILNLLRKSGAVSCLTTP